MEKIITNNNNLKESDVTEVVKRVKLLLINSNDEIMLGYSHNNFHFPGGHVEDDEPLIDTINREIQEETGIVLNLTELEPFAVAIGYYKDWPEVNKNRKIEIYYYEIKTDELPNLDNTNYTDNEKDGGFELVYIPLDSFEKILNENTVLYNDEHGINREMLELMQIYKSKK